MKELMQDLAGDAYQVIGLAIALMILVYYYLFWPKRIRMLERSKSEKDIKRLERMRRARDVYKIHWFMPMLLVCFLIGLVGSLILTIVG
jgi:predicted PurR-regulated permease PerM